MDDLNGRRAPSPDSKSGNSSWDEDDNAKNVFLSPRSQLDGAGMSRRLRKGTIQDAEEETSFMESKPIISGGATNAGQKALNIPTGSPKIDDYEGDEDNELRYFKERSTVPRIKSRPQMSEEAQHRNDLRQHFLRRSGDAARVPGSGTLLASGLGPGANLPISMDHVPSPNPPGVNEKIESFLEKLKTTRPRPTSNNFTQSDRKVDMEGLMQAWPPDMEQLLSSPEILLTKLDCTLEEYVDVVCALFGIPVENDRITALHQLFMLYLDFKEIGK